MATEEAVRRGDELPPGRYYGRWLEHDEDEGTRLACNCGHRSEWNTTRWIRLFADELHGAH